MRATSPLSGLACLAFAAVAVAATVGAQGPCLDQSFVPSPLTNGLEVTQNQPVTQTFTAGRSGQLTHVEIARIRHHNGLSSNPLQVAIVTTDASGVPTGTVLASAVFQPSDLPTTLAPLLVDLSAANVQVQQGQVLGIALTSPNAPGTPSYAWWGEAPGGSYPAGQVFLQQTLALSGWDLAFRTWVATPASAANYGNGHPGTNGAPSLSATATPVLGTTPSLGLSNSWGTSTVGALFFGLSPLSVPTPFGGTALVAPVASVGVVLASGGVLQPFPIPGDPSLCGFAVYAQGVVFDPGASQGLAFSPGLVLVLGD